MVWGINQEEPLISTPFQVNLLDAQNPKFHISGSFKVGSSPVSTMKEYPFLPAENLGSNVSKE